jgi:hypothetical protein
MTNINELIEKQEAYVKQEAEKIANEMIRRGVFTDTLSTCDYPNWDRILHRNMPEVVAELAKLGIYATSKVSYGVTDWTFKVAGKVVV